MSSSLKISGCIYAVFAALAGIASVVLLILSREWQWGLLCLASIFGLFISYQAWLPVIASIRSTRAPEERFMMRYIIKRCIPARGVLFKKGPTEESFGESNSLEIAGRLLASVPFYFDERCIIEDTRDGMIVGVKERRTL